MISVIIPVYNCEDYLSLCINSVINQTHQDFEVILVNDGSTDSSGRLCDKYVQNDSRFHSIHIDNNGPSHARNEGIRKCSGELLFFLDSDDILDKDTFQILLSAYNQHEVELVIGDFSKVVNNKLVPSGHVNMFTGDTLLGQKDILEYTAKYLSAPNKFPLLTQSWGRLFKASIIKDNDIYFNTSLRTFEDVAFNFHYLRYVKNLFFVNTPLYNLLIHTNKLSATMNMNNSPKFLFGYQEALEQAKGFVSAHWDAKTVIENISNAYIRYTIIQLIRLCLQINDQNKAEIHKFVRQTISSNDVQTSLKFYKGSPGDSKILPTLMRLKLSRLLILACRQRARQRYKQIVSK